MSLCAAMGACGGEETYVPAAEVRRMKREQRRQKEIVGSPSTA